MSADLVVLGGTVHTFDQRDRVVTGLAVRSGRVLAVGEVRRHIGPATRVIDLGGRTVLPGINDSHLHAAWMGVRWPHTLLEDNEFVEPEVTDVDSVQEAILRAGDVCAALGITSYTEPGLGPGETGCFSQTVLEQYAWLAARRLLRARVTVLRLFGRLDGPSTLPDFARGLLTPPPRADPSWLAVNGVKIFADGIPPMRTAWTHHCYPDGSNGALLVQGVDEADRAANLRMMVELAHLAGVQVGVHATGERSIEAVLEVLADRPGGRHYIVHGDLVTPDQLRRMAAAGIGLTAQPVIAAAMTGAVAEALGPEVAARAWPLAEAFDSGLPLTLSSDAPVVTPDWRVHLAAAAERLGSKGVDPDLVRRLLRCWTTAAAYQDGAEDWKGSLVPGKVADFCVLAADPLTLPAADLPSVAVLATFVGGRQVFGAEVA
ncbi:hypothetical protein GCM10010174_20130 [Kutzneria viridogrisea]|uniref:Amidohydrolase 3 domain-containing protein n=1 Tax=Kutzneria viridogrisea TaxID=47990 RepID=A0ABR6B8E2_9PSEU|nr:hypothetical protein [Kutzneria viridogrisea]